MTVESNDAIALVLVGFLISFDKLLYQLEKSQVLVFVLTNKSS